MKIPAVIQDLIMEYHEPKKICEMEEFVVELQELIAKNHVQNFRCCGTDIGTSKQK